MLARPGEVSDLASYYAVSVERRQTYTVRVTDMSADMNLWIFTEADFQYGSVRSSGNAGLTDESCTVAAPKGGKPTLFIRVVQEDSLAYGGSFRLTVQ